MCYYIQKNKVIIVLKKLINARMINAQHPKNVRATIQTTKRRPIPLEEIIRMA